MTKAASESTTTDATSTTTPSLAIPRVGFGQSLLDLALRSPLWKSVLVPQARSKMKGTAEANGIRWDDHRQWIASHLNVDEEGILTMNSNEDENIPIPLYYQKPFHAYENGNLCWEAAMEQEIASRAVGARNFPKFGQEGETVFRGAFDQALCRIRENDTDDSINNNNTNDKKPLFIVDVGCGTGTSTRRLAQQYLHAQRIVGIDLSPYFIHTAKRLMELAPQRDNDDTATTNLWVNDIQPDGRIDFVQSDAAHTPFADNSVDIVNLSFVLHEMPVFATKQVIDEAYRILNPDTGELWISEMDFDAPAYAAQRANPLLFSLLRATEPYLDQYADGAKDIRDYLCRTFESVTIAAATGRHYALVATKPREWDAITEKPACILQDLRFNADGSYKIQDTHLTLWDNKDNTYTL